MSTELFVVCCFKVPGEPRAWERARAMSMGKGRGVRFFASKEQIERQAAIRTAAKLARAHELDADTPVGLDVVASWLYPRGWSSKRIDEDLLRHSMQRTYLGKPKTTRPDMDNIVKEIGDALNPREEDLGWGVWRDDAQIVTIRSAKVWGPEAATFVRVWTGDVAPAWPNRWWAPSAP